ncbi:MAG: sigma-54-dependent Fis family transcriptional regulator [Myxococcales bacterium]|nr:sigma-54-dependent Fis family transcriptional regulator [Myxococcales bacterium]
MEDGRLTTQVQPDSQTGAVTRRYEVLVVDDERGMRRVLCAMLEKKGYFVHTAADGLEAVSILAERPIAVLITDIKMPNMDGMALLDHVLVHHPHIPTIVITAHGTVDNAVVALKKGAFDYITKPFDINEMQLVVEKALHTRELNDRNYHPAPEEIGRYDIIGRSKQMMAVYDVISKVADTPSTVLITGESGTGKELIARALHQNSSRRNKPFIAINCAAIPQNLMESELFGHEKGAFTGAVSSKAGRFELAHEGTLFLDEIGEIPVEMQVKMLRALQEGQFERVGGIQTIHVGVRVIAATNQNLQEKIKQGTFRDDLFYRLNVVPIQLPPLRDRRSDIPLLVQHFVEKFNGRLKKSIEGVTPEALNSLQEYQWPGNIRELENVVERCMLFASGSQITLQELPPELLQSGQSGAMYIPPAIACDMSMSLPELWKLQKERLEREMLRRALDQTQGNVTKAADLLGISRKSMQKKMKDLGLRENA